MSNDKQDPKKDININTGPGMPPQNIIIRETDEAPEIRQPVKPRINGDLFAPGNFYEIRKDQGLIFLDKCHLEVNWHAGEIDLYQNVRDTEQAIVKGKLYKNPDIQKLGINSGSTYDKDKLVKTLKLNRHLFEDVEVNMTLVKNLQQLSMNVEQKIEKKDDYRGGRSDVLRQTVESDIAQTFNLEMSIYRNGDPAVFEVELCFSIKNASPEFWFASPELAEAEELEREALLDEALQPFSDDDIVIIYK